MCARDRSQTRPYGQINSKVFLVRFVNLSSIPVCVRNSSGQFVSCNQVFSQLITPTAPSPIEWFSKLSLEKQLGFVRAEVDSLINNSSVISIENIFFKRKIWKIFFEKIIVNSNCFVVWRFHEFSLDASISDALKYLSSDNICEVKALLLYFSGYSHKFISDKLHISVRTSKKFVKKAYERTGLSTKDDVVSFIYSGDLRELTHELVKRLSS